MSERSKELYERAKRVIPGGVSDFLRYFKPYPIFIEKASGCKVYDVDGNEYIDFLLGYGPVILGHCHPKVTEAVKEQVDKIELFGFGCSELEFKVAEKLVENIPSVEMVRFCNAGSDATFHAIRLARAYTKKKKILKFEGAYHGWHDYVNISVMPPPDKLGEIYPQSDGMLLDAMKNTIIVPFNDLDAFEEKVRENKDELAAVIVEPILHNVGCILPEDGFLKAIREVTEKYGIVLIFDEVITCFRHHIGGVQRIFNVKPDLTCVAKSMANGYTIGAVGGIEEIMKLVKPLGNVHIGATYYANPISLAAALATLQELEKGEVYDHIFKLGEYMRKELSKVIEDLKLKAQVVGFRSITTLYFTDEPINNYRSLLSNDNEMFYEFFNEMVKQGVIMSPHPLKRWHLSLAHTKEDIDAFINSAEESLRKACKKLGRKGERS